jgi:hypothetical protein
MTVCCEHNPCPGKPRWFLTRFTTRLWRCPQCGQCWCTRLRRLWGEPDGYDWVRVIPNTSTKETTND